MATTLRDKTVLITGAALGIGAETARRLHDEGARLVLVDLDQAALEKIAGELGPDVVHVTGDVRELADMERAVAAGVDRFGGIDVVVANAGISSYGSVRAVDPAAFKRVLDVNVLGVFHTVRAALPSLVERRGYVLVVSSLAAFAASPGWPPTTPARPASSTSPTRCASRSSTRASTSGVAHMCWIDTPLVRDAKEDLPSFRTQLSKLPYPINRTTSVETCAKAFVAGIEGRKRTVFVPGWVGVLKRLRNVVNSPLGERGTLTHVPETAARRWTRRSPSSGAPRARATSTSAS